MFTFFKTSNYKITEELKMPSSICDINNCSISNIFLTILTENMICFNEMSITEEWINKNVPFYVNLIMRQSD